MSAWMSAYIQRQVYMYSKTEPLEEFWRLKELAQTYNVTSREIGSFITHLLISQC